MRVFPILTALPIVVAFGIAEGCFTNRWSLSDQTEEAAARLAAIPMTVGDWEGMDAELDPRQVTRAEMTGYLLRRYVNHRTGAMVSVLLVCGRPGPTALHTPDICFPASGYELAAAAQRRQLDVPGLDAQAEFWQARFQKGGDIAEPLLVYWAWNAAGEWIASEHPRFEFGRYPFLYKMYVTRPLPRVEEAGGASAGGADASAQFLAAFLPQVHQTLFPTAAP